MSIEAEDVLLILDTDLTSPQIDAMINTADNLVTIHIDPLADTRVTSAVRDDIVMWLAAHFCAIRDRRVKDEGGDGVRFTYEGKTGMGLDYTSYGQQAKMIDPTGKLGKISLDKRSKLATYLSSPRAESTDP